VGTSNQAAPTESETPAAQAAALLEAVRATLLEHKVEPAVAAALVGAMQVTMPAPEARRHLGDYWRGIAQRHGLRAAEKAAHVSRYHLLLAIGNMQPNPMIWSLLGMYVPLGDELDASSAEKDSAKP